MEKGADNTSWVSTHLVHEYCQWTDNIYVCTYKQDHNNLAYLIWKPFSHNYYSVFFKFYMEENKYTRNKRQNKNQNPKNNIIKKIVPLERHVSQHGWGKQEEFPVWRSSMEPLLISKIDSFSFGSAYNWIMFKHFFFLKWIIFYYSFVF